MNFLQKNELVIVAEIGVNHEGSFETAKKLLKLAASTGVDYVKFQSYTPDKYASGNDPARLKRVIKFALPHRDFVELSQMANSLRVGFLSTPVTEDWVPLLDPLCSAFKIASGDITFEEVIRKVARTGKPILMSTGGATIDEIDRAVGWITDEIGKSEVPNKLILMHCVSAYPAPIEEANIFSIPFLKNRYGLEVGYSNHVIGMNACLAAIGAGAKVIEIHFTDDKHNREFRDHSLSFDEKDMVSFVQTAREMYKALGSYSKDVQPSELPGVPLMRKGLVAARDLKKGETIQAVDIAYARPSTQFQATERDLVVGKTVKVDIPKGFLIPRDAI